MKKTHIKKYQLPPLNALKAFESAARHLSFSKAAQELFITQGAISKQIKILEDYLNTRLFHRLHKKLALTELGKEYYNHIQFVLDFIDQKSAAIKNAAKTDNSIKVHVFASFGFYWLIPRMQKFKDQYPDLNVDISIGYGSEIQAGELDCDISIWAYKKSFANIENQKFLEEEVSLVCSPKLISREIKKLNDLTNYPFLVNRYRPEVLFDWLKWNGIKKNQINSTLSFEYLFMLIEATKQGLGFGFVPTFLIADSLKDGSLINPLRIKYKTKFSYSILYPKNNCNSHKIQAFINWMFGQLK